MKRSSPTLILAPVLLALALLTACESGTQESQPEAARKLTPVTTLTVLADLIQQVGGDRDG